MPGMVELPRGLCHYTNGSGLLGIVDDKRDLWATHIFYLNDHNEYQLAYDTAKSLLERIAVLRDLGVQAPRLREAMISAMTHIARGRLPAVFVTSFAEKWDDLSQWRGYTSPGDGYGIVFDPATLRARAQNMGWRLEKCLYGQEGESALTSLLIESFRRYIAGTRADNGDGIDEAVEEFGRQILSLAPLIKDEAFRAESEWRLISPPMDDMTQKFLFRPGRSFVVPYLTFQYADPGQHVIVHINVGPGPNAELAAQAAGTLIIQRGLGCGCGRSSAPYRPW